MLQPIAHFADISHYDDSNLDLHAYAQAGASILILKASQGNAADPTFLAVLARIRTVPGLTPGSYVYLNAGYVAGQIAKYLATDHFEKSDINPILDAEALGLSKAQVFEAVVELKTRGYSQIIGYMSLAFFHDVMGGELPDGVILWLAAYREDLPELPANVKLWAWQHTDSANFVGIGHACDGSYLYASDAATYTIQ